MEIKKDISEFASIIFTLLGVLFGLMIMAFIFAQLGPGKAGLTIADEGYNQSIQIQNNSLVAMENYSEQSKTQFTTIGIVITLAVLLGLFGFIMIGASIYTSHPIMLFIGIIILAVTILLGVVYSNIYHQIAESPEFKPATDQFPISDKYMEYLPIVLFVMFIAIGAAILFALKGGGTGKKKGTIPLPGIRRKFVKITRITSGIEAGHGMQSLDYLY